MIEPDRVWWTAQEIADAGLPDMPATKRRVNAMAERLNWNAQPKIARKRAGAKGAAWEYHWSVLPMRAQEQLLRAAAPKPEPVAPADRDELWTWFEGLPDSVKDKARERLRILDEVEALVAVRVGANLAVERVARVRGISGRSIWRWRDAVAFVRPDDRLPHLAPRHRAVERVGRRAEADPEFVALVRSDWLRPEKPSLTSCYDRAVRIARAQGIEVAPIHTVRRVLDREVSVTTRVLGRDGAEALRRMYPAQQRDRSALAALEAVNADFHRFDVFVRWPAEKGRPAEIVRPQMVAFQDLYSGKLLAWRVDRTPNARAVQLAIGDLVEDWGIPSEVTLDNGREFAAKAITGGQATRYRFKVKEDDVDGLLTALGCKVHWAQPYSGQSKPIERAFRDLCDRVAKHPRFAGAYTGNRPDAKPENYQTAAVDLDVFLAVLVEEIEAHNARPARRSEVAFGRSFNEAFAESYEASPIRRATEAQRRMLMLGAEGLRVDRTTGVVRFQGNTYWSDWLHQHLGARIVARFDPADLWSGLHIYAASGEYLGHAPCREKVGFYDTDEARAHAAAHRAWVKAEREALARHRTLTAAQLGQALADLPPPDSTPAPEAKIVRPFAGRPAPKGPDPERQAEMEAAQDALILDMASRRRPEPDESDLDRFRRALELEDRIAAGEPVTPDQRRWVEGYRLTAEYQGHRDMLTSFGRGYLAT